MFIDKYKNIKVAFVHDWLNGMRGGEKVLQAMLELFPGADIYTLFLEKEKIDNSIKKHKIFTSYLNKYSFIRNRYRYFLPFFPTAIESFNLNQYDLIISTSHCVAKGAIPNIGTPHISYIHSPMRYIWDQRFFYFKQSKSLKSFIREYFLSNLRVWDISSIKRVTKFIANSSFVSQRIKTIYGEKSDIIHPPIDTDFFNVSKEKKNDFFLCVSAFVPYKRIDLLIEAFNKNKKKLIIVGHGPKEKKLKSMIKDNNIQFVKGINREELKKLYQQAKAVIFAGTEDFGMVFPEAQACGTPIIAYNKGGVKDVVTQESGILFENDNIENIINAINEFEKQKFDIQAIRKQSLKFSKSNFLKKFKLTIEDTLNDC